MPPQQAYTNNATPHPNLLIGCWQILFWLLFRPSVWKHYVFQLNPLLDHNFSLLQLITPPWPRQFQRFLLQGFILPPILASVIPGIIALGSEHIFREAASTAYFSGLIGIVNGLLIGGTLGVPYGILNGIALSIAGLLFNPIIFGLSTGMAYGAAYGTATGKPVGLIGGSLGGISAGFIGLLFSSSVPPLLLILFSGLAGGTCSVLSLLVVSGISGVMTDQYNTIRGFLGGLAFGTTLVFLGKESSHVALGVSLSVGLWINRWRPFLLSALLVPWHLLLYYLDSGGVKQFTCQFHHHQAFWDEWLFLRVPGLDKHLLTVLNRFPREGQAALNYLSISRQRWAAQSAQIELDASKLQVCDTCEAIAQSHRNLSVGDLDGPADTLFRSFNRISEDVNSALQQSSAYNQRLALTMVSDRLDALLRELTRSSDKYAVRFQPIAQQWIKIIAETLQDLTLATEQNQEIDCPYILGVPLTARQSIFVGRTNICARIEHLIRDQQSPPLMLYGQRRMGKTSLLNNLGRLLPTHIVPLFIDLQGPVSRSNHHSGFLYNLARGMSRSAHHQRQLTLPPLSRESLEDDPFTRFDEWLDEIEVVLGDKTALLALDEFEALEQALIEGRYQDTVVLGMFRNLIQHRHQFKVLFAGSHALSEFQRWSSYLINAQVLHLGNLTSFEARQLIVQPIENFSLQYAPEAIEYLLRLTQGHPYLIQLICTEIIFLKNEQPPSQRRWATVDDVERAIPEALSNGSMFFSDIEHNQLTADALKLLQTLAHHPEGTVLSLPQLMSDDPETNQMPLHLLLQRELITPTDDGYSISIELIRRWFEKT